MSTAANPANPAGMDATSDVPTLPPVASGRSRLTDFPDRLGPMVVKELRQGLRSRAFVAIFILMQGFICITLLGSLSTPGTDAGGGPYWAVVWIVLLVALPMRGMQAVTQERSATMLELITLTKLTSYRIVAGKWAALSAQSLLVVICLLPCTMLRYFAFGISVAEECIALLLIAAIGMVGNAVGVAVSCFPERWSRGLLMLGLLFIGLWSVGGVWSMFMFDSFDMFGPSLIAAVATWEFWICMLLPPLAVVFFLLFGAGLIAGPAENHSTPRRLLVTGVLLVMLGLRVLLDLDPDAFIAFALLIFIAAVADACTDAPRLLPRVTRPFVRAGPFGRIGAWLLAPGWHTAPFWLLLVVCPLVALLVPIVGGSSEALGMGLMLAIGAGTVFWGTVFDRLMYRHQPPSLPRMILIQVIAWILAAFAVAYEAATLTDDVSVSILLPHAMFINLFRLSEGAALATGGLPFDTDLLMIGLLQTLVAVVILMAMARPLFTGWRRSAAKARQDLADRAAAKAAAATTTPAAPAGTPS